MVWNSVGDFLRMGGYGLYVWGSVLVTFGFMLTEVALLVLRRGTILGYLGRVHQADKESGDESQA